MSRKPGLIEAGQFYMCLVVFEGHEKPPVLLGTTQCSKTGKQGIISPWVFISHCLFWCPYLDSIQMPLLMSFWVWCLVIFAMRVTAGQIKCGPSSPEVQVTSVYETSGALLRLCFELVSQICNSRNPVKHPQLGPCWNWDAGTCLCSAMLCHPWAQLGLEELGCVSSIVQGTLQQCHSCVLCTAWGWVTQGQHVQASHPTSGLGIQSGLYANQGKNFSLMSNCVCS